jgi:hypothetical protein
MPLYTHALAAFSSRKSCRLTAKVQSFNCEVLRHARMMNLNERRRHRIKLAAECG